MLKSYLNSHIHGNALLDAGYGRAKDAYITVAAEKGDIFYTAGNDDNLCGYYGGVLNRYYTLINCNPVLSGQFVQIQFNTTDYLNLYEIEVHGI